MEHQWKNKMLLSNFYPNMADLMPPKMILLKDSKSFHKHMMRLWSIMLTINTSKRKSTSSQIYQKKNLTCTFQVELRSLNTDQRA